MTIKALEEDINSSMLISFMFHQHTRQNREKSCGDCCAHQELQLRLSLEQQYNLVIKMMKLEKKEEEIINLKDTATQTENETDLIELMPKSSNIRLNKPHKLSLYMFSDEGHYYEGKIMES